MRNDRENDHDIPYSISCILGICAALALPGIAWGAGHEIDREFGETRVKAWISNPIVTAALRGRTPTMQP